MRNLHQCRTARNVNNVSLMSVQILASGDLVISQIDWMQHMGTYKCVAENEGGLDSVSTFLYPVSASEGTGNGGRKKSFPKSRCLKIEWHLGCTS